MNANTSIASPTPKPVKPLSYFPSRDGGPSAFPSHHPVPANNYFQQQHNVGGGSFNPLYVQTRNGYFHPYSYSSYEGEQKAPTAGFQSISNGMNQTLGPMHFNSYAPPYSADGSHQRGPGDFDI